MSLRRRPSSPIDVQSYPDLDALPEAAIRLIAAAGAGDFFASLDWYRIVLRTTGLAIDRPLIHVAATADRILAVLIVRDRERAGPLGTHVVSSPSRGLYAATYAPILDPEDGEAGLAAIIETMLRRRPPVHVLRLECLNAESRGYQILVKTLRDRGMHVEPFPEGYSTFTGDAAGLTIEQYLARRPPEMQAFITKQVAAFAALGRGQFEIVSEGPSLPAALVDFALVDLQSWKEQELFPDCIPALLTSAARAGALRLTLLYIDERPAAAQMWIVSNGRATMWRSHFARQFATLSVGTIITYESIRHLLATDRPERLEFGPGTDAGRQQWLEQRHDRSSFVAFNRRTAKGWAAAMRYRGGILTRSARQRARGILGLVWDRD